MFEHLLPGGEGGVFLAKLGQCFSVGHLRVAVIVAGVLLHDFFEEGRCFLRFALAEQALAEMRLEVDVGGVAFDGGAGTADWNHAIPTTTAHWDAPALYQGMLDGLRGYIQLANGLTDVTRERARS